MKRTPNNSTEHKRTQMEYGDVLQILLDYLRASEENCHELREALQAYQPNENPCAEPPTVSRIKGISSGDLWSTLDHAGDLVTMAIQTRVIDAEDEEDYNIEDVYMVACALRERLNQLISRISF